MPEHGRQDTLELPRLDPTQLPVAELVRLLRSGGSHAATLESLQADIDRGAPINTDGTINLMHYAAWLIREVARGD